MKGIDFIDGLSDIDMDYVNEADETPARKKSYLRYYVSLAACLAVMITSGLLLAGGALSKPVSVSNDVASMIGTTTGLFWIIQIAGAIGIIITLVLLIRSKKN